MADDNTENDDSMVGIVKGVWEDLKKGNQLKKDLEQAKITGKSEHHADNYAHILTDAKIAQKSGMHTFVALCIGAAKEAYDFTTKVFRGENVAETYRDCVKDMKNNLTGLKWGRKNPDKNAEEWLAQLDLDSNTFVEGYDNGIAQSRYKIQEQENLKRKLQQDRALAMAVR